MIDVEVAPTPAEVLERLADVIDPEVGIGIVDLGLVYDVTIDERAIAVTMTMTTPACPLGPYLEEAVEATLGDVAEARLVTVEVTFDPPWSPDMITEEGRRQLGWAP
jgi:metal-sulfur cluster biosynthetic enzyme